MEIVRPTASTHWDAVRTLFEEYWDSFGFTPCFQGFGDELAGSARENYAPPSGVPLALAFVDGAPGRMRRAAALR